MTITEANAANVIAADALNLAKNGVPVSAEVKQAIRDLLDGAYRRLRAGRGYSAKNLSAPRRWLQPWRDLLRAASGAP